MTKYLAIYNKSYYICISLDRYVMEAESYFTIDEGAGRGSYDLVYDEDRGLMRVTYEERLRVVAWVGAEDYVLWGKMLMELDKLKEAYPDVTMGAKKVM